MTKNKRSFAKKKRTSLIRGEWSGDCRIGDRSRSLLDRRDVYLKVMSSDPEKMMSKADKMYAFFFLFPSL